ncbi:hypothetical protein EMCRGX_G021725 [Ephydatia muelleri]
MVSKGSTNSKRLTRKTTTCSFVYSTHVWNDQHKDRPWNLTSDDEDDVMLKQMTLIAAVVLMEVILVPDFKNAPDPEDISVLRCGNWFYMRNFPHFLKVLMLHVLNLICFGSAADEEDDVMLKQMTLIAAVVLWRLF